MSRKRVLVTGSAGTLGRAAVQELRRWHDVQGFDRIPSPELKDAFVGDLTDAEAVEEACNGQEVVVHLAATPDEDDFMERLLPNNIVGVYNLFEGARKAGVRRIVAASSGMVVSGQQSSGPWPITTNEPFSPRHWYSATKIFCEAVGHLYAHTHGRSVIVVRLGWCPRTREVVHLISGSEIGRKMYLSPGDAGRFFRCAVEATDELRYAIVFATSRPPGEPVFDITSARDLLGYEPQDTWPEGTERFGTANQEERNDDGNE